MNIFRMLATLGGLGLLGVLFLILFVSFAWPGEKRAGDFIFLGGALLAMASGGLWAVLPSELKRTGSGIVAGVLVATAAIAFINAWAFSKTDPSFLATAAGAVITLIFLFLFAAGTALLVYGVRGSGPVQGAAVGDQQESTNGLTWEISRLNAALFWFAVAVFVPSAVLVVIALLTW